MSTDKVKRELLSKAIDAFEETANVDELRVTLEMLARENNLSRGGARILAQLREDEQNEKLVDDGLIPLEVMVW